VYASRGTILYRRLGRAFPNPMLFVIALPPTTGDDAFSDRIKAIKKPFCTGAAADGGAFIDTNCEG
jgi:hypothetical protein